MLTLGRSFYSLKNELDTPEAKAFYEAGAYDGRKNFFTPNAISKGEKKTHEFTINLPDTDPKPGVPVEEQGRRWKVQIKHVADIDSRPSPNSALGRSRSSTTPRPC